VRHLRSRGKPFVHRYAIIEAEEEEEEEEEKD
jgi:CO dehydrogenase/acetyl-CoA synthase beta subunit